MQTDSWVKVWCSLALLSLFCSFQSKKAEGVQKGADKDFLTEAERLEVKDKGPLILAELLLDENVTAQLKLYRMHFLRVS